VIVAAIWIPCLAETNSIRPQIKFYFPGLTLSCYLAPSLLPSQLYLLSRKALSSIPGFLICLTLMTCHPSLFAGNMPTMKTFTSLITIVFAALIATPSFAQTSGTSPAIGTAPVGAATAPTGQPNPQEMMKQMMEMSKLNENHKLLADMNGSWNYSIKMWMNPDPNAKPQESKGTATRKSAMGGRYFTMDVTGKLQMPGEDGKMKDMQFKGMALEGYDNVKKKFVSSWIDNMGTGIQYSEGTYDPATKTFTFTSEMEMMPGMKTPVREVLKMTDKDHIMMEWYETHGGQEKKTMEIAYTRAGKK
jgi:hypothetical protein